MPPRLPCTRCRTKPATNGPLCVACSAKRHVWEGNCHDSTCQVCGTQRFKLRKRTRPGQSGSHWQTWYDMLPESGKPNPIPPCK